MEGKKLDIGGIGLYAYPAEAYREVFGLSGRAIYDTIHIPSTSPSASRREIPTAPSPSATVQEVQCFFRDCLLAFRPLLDQEEAEMEGKKLDIGGIGLYAYSAETYRDVFGHEGRAIYAIVHNEYYRYVSYIYKNFISYQLI